MRLIWLSLRQRVTQFYRRTLGILQIAGILILIMPRLLNYIVAGYLILVGVAGLLSTTGFNLSL